MLYNEQRKGVNMKGQFLVGLKKPSVESNVYANKSSVVLDWLLQIGVDKEKFSLREVARETNVSLGLVQLTFKTLVLVGLLNTEGVRSAKRFFFKKPDLLLKNWIEHYDIIKKCKMWTYQSGFKEKADILKTLEVSKLHSKVVLALHSAAEVHGYKNTNLQTLELYMLDSSIRPELEKTLQLEPQERGYEVLLIEPYYKNLLNLNIDPKTNIKVSPILLTFLDLYHFPLRGQEQAEFMAKRISNLKHIYKKVT